MEPRQLAGKLAAEQQPVAEDPHRRPLAD